jgi:hypothetical protein
MKKRFTGVLIGLGLSLILLGNFSSLGFAQTIEEQCGAYEVCTKDNGMLIENLFFNLKIQYDNQTGRLVVDFDQNRGGFEIREGKKMVGFRDTICGAEFIADNFKKVPFVIGEYTVKDDKKPVDFSFTRFRDDCRHCTKTDIGIKFSPLNP